MINPEELAKQLGQPAIYHQNVREAVARIVAQPLEDGTPIDEIQNNLETGLNILIDDWLTGEPEYPATHALTITQLAYDFVRFTRNVRELSNCIPVQSLPTLIEVVRAIEGAGIVSGDWSWCHQVTEHLLTSTKEALDIDNPDTSAN